MEGKPGVELGGNDGCWIMTERRVRCAYPPYASVVEWVSRAHPPACSSYRPNPKLIGVIAKVRREPPLYLAHAHPFALRVIFHLVALDLRHGEIFAFRVAEIPAGD